jgi:hypothetical protein
LVAVASFEERMYELGSEALAEQERQVAELRGRGATLLAAGAVIASLLAKPVFDGEHPHGFAEIAATAIGLLGSTGILVSGLVGTGHSPAANGGYRPCRGLRGAPERER